MKRSAPVRAIVLSLVSLSLMLLAIDSALAQKRGRSSAPTKNEAVSSDWRNPETAAPSPGDYVDAGDGFKAHRLDGGSVTVDIPGAYVDTIQVGGHGPDLNVKLAAAVFVKVTAAPTQDPEEALQKYYLGEKNVRQPNGEVHRVHSFRLSNGRTARIFVYFNDRYGLTGVVQTGPASIRK
jgi:hypothetical protein